MIASGSSDRLSSASERSHQLIPLPQKQFLQKLRSHSHQPHSQAIA
ncbi:hypothetical protein [Phormidium sp. CCY1219]|nr:hypothetical protein [Phormidium sp. CCY1219]MEB3828367.1 hypothetical protein [Phormidium sp. CCY1219]